VENIQHFFYSAFLYKILYGIQKNIVSQIGNVEAPNSVLIDFTCNELYSVISFIAINEHKVNEVCSIIANAWKVYAYLHSSLLKI
jgi:hypothetical protein